MRNTIGALLLLAISGTSFAEGFDYTFIQATYGHIDFSDIDADGDGFGISGSFAIADEFHLFAGYQLVGLDFDVDASEFDLGIGFNTPISDKIDVIAQLAYVRAEVDAPILGSVTDDGYGIGLGLRTAPSESVELNVGVNYVDFGDGGDDTALGAGVLYNFTDTFSVGLSGSWSDNTSALQIGGRFYF